MSDTGALGLQAFHDLEARRKAHRLADWNIIDALYKAYMTALGGGVAVLWLSGVVADDLDGTARRLTASRGPALLGLVLAVLAWTGARSGGRGGPLTVTTATVRTVLLAPVDRSGVLRGPALRQLRFAAFAGTVVGAVAGAFAFRRFGGPPPLWIASMATFGTAAGLLLPGVALLVAGRRVPAGLVRATIAILAGMAAVDLEQGAARTPLAVAGAYGLAPLAGHPGASFEVSTAAIGAGVLVALAVVTAVVGVLGVGGVSIERLERRSRLVTLLRFAATVRDLRAVITFRRLLGQEESRARPWVRVPAMTAFPVWRRDWQGVLRWPAVRFGRLAGLGVVAGLATVAALTHAGELSVVAAAALFFAAAEASEGVAQEADHPTLSRSLPLHEEALWMRHLAVPTVLMAGVGSVAVATAAAVVGRAALVGLVLVVPAAAAAVTFASRSARQQPDPTESMRIALTDTTGSAAVMQLLGPPLKAGSAPLLLVVLHRAAPQASWGDLVRLVVVIETVLVVAALGYHGAIRPKIEGSDISLLGA